ncbi:disease resistance protein RPV1-like [Cryptomeria japonica]|uniref:disease resistance protein RPV1-like n=1 Tax=Cryptomeria japonica TaxID=3369 RepID=UPI0027DA2617|nr:disease resistance protein RPV1-like [Cryptomeria japonica]
MDGVVKVGIWGIGGIGKTTIAKAVYNQIYTDFEAASFVSIVRSTAADDTGLTKLQMQILEQLTKYEGTAYNVDQGMSLLRERLGGKCVMLILDDVDGVKQLDALVGDWLAHHSRVIITTRDKHILNVAKVSSECIHEMRGLDMSEGLQLFSWHAFLKASASPDYEHLSKEIVEACKGHPLSLEVIGSFLYDKQDDTDCWMEALRNITRYPEIQERLYISYDALNDVEKEIFLDIACVFIGEEKSLPVVFWKSVYRKVYSVVSNLLMKSSIKIDDEGRFDMHDHLRDMGQGIAEKEKECTRLSEANVLNTITNNRNFSRIRINGGNSQRLEQMFPPGLRYLDLEDLSIEGVTQDTLAMLPTSLIWLRLADCDFEMNRAIKKPGHSSINIWQLKIMQLQFCDHLDSFLISSIFSLPDIQLQHLDMVGCIGLNKLPDSIGNLSQLQHLDMECCDGLDNLPDFIGNLSQLQYLNMEWCDGLNKLSDSIGNLSQLQHLDMGWCTGLNNLSDSIDNLSQLQRLDMRGCNGFNNLPDSIGNLTQLQHLYMRECTSLNNLPDSIGNLSQLQHLDMRGCNGLNNLPDSIGNLSQLQHLDMGGCTGLNNPPDSIGNLSQLQHLDMGGCEGLNNLPDSIGNMSQLQHLDMPSCTGLNKLPDSIGKMSQLQHLDMRRCYGLNNLPDSIGNLSQLQHLNMGWCDGVNKLPDSIGNLSQLQHLNMGWCDGLNKLPDSIGNLSQLQHFNIENCSNLNNLPDDAVLNMEMVYIV